MGVVKETLKTLISPKRLALIGIGYSVYEQYKDSGKSAYEFFGKPTIDKLKEVKDRTDAGLENMQKKNMGGMMNARKKNMGLKMKRGGSVKKRAKSSSKKSRGTGAAIRGTKFKGVF